MHVLDHEASETIDIFRSQSRRISSFDVETIGGNSGIIRVRDISLLVWWLYERMNDL